ncbi:MAG: hypothetical protein ABIR33_00870 [Pyrinomonadaceae bacterium]
MMKFVISFTIGLAAALAIAAQTPTSSPPPAPPPSSTPAPQNSSSQTLQTRAVSRFPQNFPLNPVSESDRLASRVVRLQWLIAPLYKKPGSKETASLAPDASFFQQYASLLKADGTGIVRLAPDRGCVYSERVVNVAEACLKYSFPGAGNSFSFRTEGYRLRHLADITYVDDKLRMTGIFMHGIAVDLGNIPIENASLSTEGISYLISFEPSTTPEEVVTIDQNLTRGIRFGNFVYAKEVDPQVDRTYAIRAIAYRGKVVRSAGGVSYNELDYDKRRDVTVVFRVVEMDKDGLTLVWRKLADWEPPRIKMPRVEKEADDGEAN